MTKGLSTIAAEAQELKATISQLATALTNNEQAHTRLKADMEAAQAKLKALQEASVAAFDELAAIAERREPEAAVGSERIESPTQPLQHVLHDVQLRIPEERNRHLSVPLEEAKTLHGVSF